MKVVSLVSGGLDSVVALHAASRDHEIGAVLSFHYAAKHNARELPMARWHADRLSLSHTVIDLGFMNLHFRSELLSSGGEIPEGHYEEESMRQTVVPFRNGILLSVAAGFAESHGAQGVVIAAHAGDHAIYPDCRESFMEAMGQAIRQGTYAGIQLLRPFIALRKEDIVALGTAMEVDLAKTWSCYKGGQRHCGRCGTCVERREAFERAGIADPTAYEDLSPLPSAPRS